jgi:hypothetical protein
LAKIEEYEKLIDGGTRFLDSTVDMVGNRVAFASYPRSGNSFLRKILENISGVFTGSDEGILYTLSLQQQGLLGEGTCGDDSVWISKTHYPFTNFSSKWTADKIICIVRNPIDVLPSQASLYYSLSMSLEVKKPWNEYWKWPHFVRYMTPVWGDWHRRVK